MSEQQALNATFFAFRKRAQSGVLLKTTIAYVVIALVSFGLFVALNLAALSDYVTWYAGLVQSSASGNVDQSMVMPPASVMALGPLMFLFQIFYYVIMAAYEAACLRWLIKGEQRGFFGFTFGADTWRVYLGYWIWALMAVAMGLTFFIVFGGIIGSMFAIGATSGEGVSFWFMSLVMPLLALALLILIGWLCVRLAPAAATSIARNRFAFFDAWKVTRGRFWALLGAFVLLWIMYFVATTVLYGAGGVAFAMGVMSSAQHLSGEPSPEQVFGVLMQPAIITPLLLICAVAIVASFIWMIAMFGINARAAALALEEGKITAEA